MRIIQNNLKEVALAFIMGALVALGIIAAAGSLNWGVRGGEGWLYIVAGIGGIGVTVYAAIAFYRQFLKPDFSGIPKSEVEKANKK